MRLIDAEILRDRLYKTRNAALADGRNKAYGKGFRDAIEILEAQPTVEPELLKHQPDIVRCKDCAKWDRSTMKHYEDVICGSGDTAECGMFCDMDSWGEFTDEMRRTDGDWFCADGKRRVDDA